MTRPDPLYRHSRTVKDLGVNRDQIRSNVECNRNRNQSNHINMLQGNNTRRILTSSTERILRVYHVDHNCNSRRASIRMRINVADTLQATTNNLIRSLVSCMTRTWLADHRQCIKRSSICSKHSTWTILLPSKYQMSP